MPRDVESRTANSIAHRAVPGYMSQQISGKKMRRRELAEQLSVHDDERDVLSLSSTHVSARSLVHGHEVLDAGDSPDDPAWLTDLRSSLAEQDTRSRGVLLAAVRPA